MTSSRFIASLAAACGLVASFGNSSLAAPPRSVPTVRIAPFAEEPGVLEFTGQLIVRPLQTLAPAARAQAQDQLQGLVLRYYADVDEYIVAAPATPGSAGARGEAENALSQRLMATGLFQYAVPNWFCYPLKTSNDPLLGSQWHHTTIQSPQAWDISTGRSDMIVAVTDTGVYHAHPDLASHLVPGYDAYNNIAEVDGGSTEDIHGHGTHVAGCAAAIGNNGVGVAGVNWNAKIMMIRVAADSSGGAYYEDLMEGARWAIEHGAKTVSASYSGVDYDPIQTTGAYIKSIGGLYLYAAGNDNRDLSWFDWQDVIVVGATDQGDVPAWFTATGNAVDVYAPGVGILSSVVGGGYQAWSGTSMATPVANGVASLIWSMNPSFTPDQVQNMLFSSCTDLGTPGNDSYWGWGRVNAYNAVLAARAQAGPQPPAANADSALTVGTSPVTIDVIANDFDPNGDAITISSFTSTSSAGGVITRSVGTGPGGRDQLVYVAPAGFHGGDTFAYQASDGSLSAAGAVSVDVIDPATFRAAENPRFTRPSLDVDYYVTSGYSALPNFASLTPYSSSAAPQINYPSTGGVFADSGRAEEVGAVYTGYLVIDNPGVYTLYTESDDGSRLLLGSDVVVNNDGLHGMAEVGATIGLQAGMHALRVEFWENFGGAGLIVSISGPGLSKQPIPASMLRRDRCPADFDQSGYVDIDDFNKYVVAFEMGTIDADFDGTGFVDFEDFCKFVVEFETGC